jgi:hypothetical protein
MKEVTVAGRIVPLGNKAGVQNFDRTLLFYSKREVQDPNLAQSDIFCGFIK